MGFSVVILQCQGHTVILNKSPLLTLIKFAQNWLSVLPINVPLCTKAIQIGCATFCRLLYILYIIPMCNMYSLLMYEGERERERERIIRVLMSTRRRSLPPKHMVTFS